MPEGPEVRIITEWLHLTYKLYRITNCCDDYKKVFGYKKIIGYEIEWIGCKGKQIFFKLIKENSENLSGYLNKNRISSNQHS